MHPFDPFVLWLSFIARIMMWKSVEICEATSLVEDSRSVLCMMVPKRPTHRKHETNIKHLGKHWNAHFPTLQKTCIPLKKGPGLSQRHHGVEQRFGLQKIGKFVFRGFFFRVHSPWKLETCWTGSVTGTSRVSNGWTLQWTCGALRMQHDVLSISINILSQRICNNSVWSPCPLLCHHIPLVMAPALAKIPRSCPPLIEDVLPVVPNRGRGSNMGKTQQNLPQNMMMCKLWGTTSPTKCFGLGYKVVPLPSWFGLWIIAVGLTVDIYS